METKEYLEQEVQREDIRAPYALRAYFAKFIIPLITGTISIYLAMTFPEKGFAVKDFFSGGLASIMIATFSVYVIGTVYSFVTEKKAIMYPVGILATLLFFLYLNQSKMIPVDPGENIFFVLGAILLVHVSYIILYVKTAVVLVNRRDIRVIEGVFSRMADSTDLTEIVDKDMMRSGFDMFLGLSKLKLKLKRSKSELIIDNLKTADVKEIFDYLRAHSHGSSTEYWSAKDRAKSDGKSQSEDVRYVESGDGEGGSE
jgi:hypothetical protein